MDHLIKTVFSTDQLAPQLDEPGRFRTWSELCERVTTTAEFDRTEDVPFNARIEIAALGTTLIARSAGTFRTVRRGRKQILKDSNDRYCLVRNIESRDFNLIHRGRQLSFRPGAITLLKLDEGFTGIDDSKYKRWTNIHIPANPLRAMVRNLDDLLGRDLAPRGALSLAMAYGNLILDSDATTIETKPAFRRPRIFSILRRSGLELETTPPRRRGPGDCARCGLPPCSRSCASASPSQISRPVSLRRPADYRSAT